MSADDDFMVEGEPEDDFITSDDSQEDDFITSDASDDSDEDIIEMLEESERAEQETKGELTKFLILAIIMLGTIGVVYLAIPVIFGQIVPAVMNGGSDEPTAVEVLEGEEIDDENANEETEAGSSEEGSEENAGEEASGEEAAEEASGSEEASGEEMTEEAVDEGEEAAEGEETAESEETEEATEENTEEGTEPAVAIRTTYTVRQGDTLGAIARLYELPEQSIIDANGITNPNLIKVGDELKIPEK